MRLPFILILALSVFSCTEPVIDASDEDSLETSFSRILRQLPADQRLEVSKEFSRIRNAYMGHIAFRFEGETRELRQRRFFDAVEGMDVEQISQESIRVQQAWDLGTLLSIRKEYSDFNGASELLDKIKLVSYRFIPLEPSLNRARGDRNKASFEAVISNDTKYSVHSVIFTTDMHNNDGSFKLEYGMYFEIPDGIKPGEEKSVIAYSSVSSNEGMEPGYNRYSNFKADSVYGAANSDGSENIIATINYARLPTIERVSEAETKYRLKHGDHEPAEWSANIERELGKHNQYRGY